MCRIGPAVDNHRFGPEISKIIDGHHVVAFQRRRDRVSRAKLCIPLPLRMAIWVSISSLAVVAPQGFGRGLATNVRWAVDLGGG